MLSRITAAACAVVFVAGVATGSYRLGQQADLDGGVPAAIDVSVPEALEPLAELYRRIQSEAVDVPPDRELVDGALEGMLEALSDPYAVYYDPDAFAEFNELLDGSFSGVGLLLEEDPDRGFVIVSVLDGAPAQAAGIEAGERIVSVDGRDVREGPIELVVGLVKGEPGTDVTLGLEGGSQGPREVTVTRAEIDLPTVDARQLDDGAGYIQLFQFSEGAGEHVRDAVESLVADGAPGIVLDLRGNPGGLLHEAVEVASVFIEDGVIVSVEEREQQRDEFEARGDALEDVALVVLIDGGSASASEIVAGAVQELERGTLVGEVTFGKGTVQTVQVLSDGSGAKFTTAAYYTPSGRSIEGSGIEPDRVVSGADAQLAAAQEALRALLAGAPPG